MIAKGEKNMYLKDFIYDNDKLSNLGCIIGSLDSNNNEGLQITKITFDTVVNNGTYINNLIDSKYDNVVTLNFSVFKNSCIHGNDLFFTDNEISYFVKWLSKKGYHKFMPIYDDFSYYSTYFIGSFTEVTSIIEQGNVIGLSLTFQANAPFGFTHVGKIKTHSSAVTESGITTHRVCIINTSDEIGILYPNSVQIKLEETPPSGQNDETGKFIMYNLTENIARKTTMIGCIANEILTFDCVHKIVESSVSEHTTIYKDFNYNFPRLFSTMESGENILCANVPFDIEIDYSPIKKVGAI